MTYQQLANLIALMTDEEKNNVILIRSNNLEDVEEVSLLSKEYAPIGTCSITLVTEPLTANSKNLGRKRTMTPEEFKKRWESDDGISITFDDMADCAIAWGLSRRPKTRPLDVIRYLVLKAADTVDCEEFKPEKRD